MCDPQQTTRKKEKEKMRKSIQVLVLSLVVAAIAVPSFAAESSTSSPASGVVNINTADATQLALLPGIGAKVAQRVVDYRAEHGPYKTTGDVGQMKRLGAKTLDRHAPHIALDGTT